MNNVPNEDIITAAIEALKPFHPTSAEQAGDMLLFWRRRAELTDVDLAEVTQRMFPAEPGRPHRSEDYREGYAEGFIDAIRLKLESSAETRDAVASVVERRDDLTDAEVIAIRAAIAGVPWPNDGGLAERFLRLQRAARAGRSPAEQLIDETHARWQREAAQRLEARQD